MSADIWFADFALRSLRSQSMSSLVSLRSIKVLSGWSVGLVVNP
jgi:hypothetical protein